MDTVRRAGRVSVSSVWIAALVGALGCHSDFDSERDTVDTGTFGTTVQTLACKRMAYLDDLADGGTVDVRGDAYRDICRAGLAAPATASGSLRALQTERERLIGAVDGIFPEEFLPDLQTFLTSNEFLALYDNETATAAIDSLIATLRFLAADDEAVGALERLGHRLGYRPLTPAIGAARAVVNYPGLHDFVLAVTTAITPGGAARGEWENLIEALGISFRNAEAAADPDAPDRPLRIALDFLLRERTLLGTATQVPVATRDPRGVAKVQALGTVMPAPFVDLHPADGQADTDLLGRFVDAAGVAIDAPSPFTLADDATATPWQHRDSLGRALASDGGALLYQYVDLDKTVMAALARDGVQLFDPQKGTAFDLLRGASALVGPRLEATKTYDNGESLTYRGYQIDESPLLDMSYGYLQLLRDPAIYDTLALAKTVVQDHEADAARLAEAVIAAARKADNHPEASIVASAPMWDDMMPIIRQILDRPALVQALMTAMEKPEVAQLGERLRKFLTYTDRFDINSQTQAVVGAFATMVDRMADDSGFNRSLFQRILHVINDTNGASACNKAGATLEDPLNLGLPLNSYDECELFRVDNLAVFYMQSIAYAKNSAGQYICENAAGDFDDTTTASTPQGCTSQGGGRRPRPKADFNYDFGASLGFIPLRPAIDLLGGDKFLEDTVGIAGMRTHPTPQALNRVLFLNPMPEYMANIVAPLRDKEGDLISAQHAGTLPVWEVEGFYDQIRPVVQAFADNNAENLFVDMLSVLHKHWPSTDSINHQTFDPGAPGYVFGSRAMSYEALIADMLADGTLMGALSETAPRMNAITANGKAYEEIIRVAARYFLTPQAGLADRQGRTTTTTADGRAVNQLSPWHLLADAYRRKAERMAVAGAEGEAWTDSIAEVVDVLARGVDVSQQGWRFRNARMRGVSIALLELLESRLRAHDTAGDRAAWLSSELLSDLQEVVTGPVFAGAADFVLSLQAAPETRLQLEQLMQYLVDEASSADSFATSVTAAADLAQIALDDRDLLPLARAVGEIIRPERGWLETQLLFVRDARASDANQALSRLFANLYAEHLPGRSPVGDLIDSLSEILRADPSAHPGARLDAADYRALFTGVADFLDEEKRGLRKFIAIIKSRNL